MTNNNEPTLVCAMVRADCLDLRPFCHEALEAIPMDELYEMIDSVLRHGLPDGIEFFRDDQGRCILVRGHRWIHACRILAVQGAPGFAFAMKVRASQILQADPTDLLLRSTDDSDVRYRLNYFQRLEVARKLHAAGIPAERAAAALALPVQTYEALVARVQQLDPA